MNNYRLIAMIPARMGSRRIKKKNIRYMLDKPLIKYPIDFAINSNRFESIWINTESEELGIACEKFGAKFHRRPVELASDKATNRDFVYEFLKKHDCDYVIMINPHEFCIFYTKKSCITHPVPIMACRGGHVALQASA